MGKVKLTKQPPTHPRHWYYTGKTYSWCWYNVYLEVLVMVLGSARTVLVGCIYLVPSCNMFYYCNNDVM